ncbi:MAG TPA: IS110 family transposase [Nitrospinae bacterium]|nr:IS110 family transposase [Nitrospinota bacterium]
MTHVKSTIEESVLVAIDIAKARNHVLIDPPGGSPRKRFKMANAARDFRDFAVYLKGFALPVRVGFEATGNYHRPLAHFLLTQGFEVRLISSVALARTREAMHNSWDKNDPKDAQVILHLLKVGLTQIYHDPLFRGINDAQELSKTYHQVSLEKTRVQHRLLTHYLPFYFPEAQTYHHSARSEWLFRLLLAFPIPTSIPRLGEEAFIAQAGDVVGRKVNKARILADFYRTALESIGLPVAEDSQAVAMFRLVLGEYLTLCQLRGQIEQTACDFFKEDADYFRLTQVPGIALTILAEAGDLRRFSHHRQFLKFCGLDLSTRQSGRFRGATKLSKYGNARLRSAFWMAASAAVRLRENSFRAKFDRYIRHNPQDPDLKRKAYCAVAAKVARVVHGLIKNGTDYRPYHEEAIPSGGVRSGGP